MPCLGDIQLPSYDLLVNWLFPLLVTDARSRDFGYGYRKVEGLTLCECVCVTIMFPGSLMP